MRAKSQKKRDHVALTPPSTANHVEEEFMEDESHDSKLAKVEETEDVVKPTLRDGTKTRLDPGNSIYFFVFELDRNPTYVA